MWTAVRLLAVCVLGVSCLFAVRSGLPSRSPRPPPPAIHAEADDGALGDPIAKVDDQPAIENGKKIVTVERFLVDVAALDANDKAPPEPNAEVLPHRRRFHHHRWHRRRRHNN